jgi:hypothetical protein
MILLLASAVNIAACMVVIRSMIPDRPFCRTHTLEWWARRRCG